jgi:DNA-binding transcriptional MerR regulator
MTEQLFSIRDCGKVVGVAAHKIAYAHTQERLAEPQFRVAGKRIYTAEDVRRVAKYFAGKPAKKGGKDGNGA